MAETFNDPFGDNQTPWGLEVDPFAGFAICQNNLETGDVIKVLTSLPTYSIAMNGLTYHPQNEALFPWFVRVTITRSPGCIQLPRRNYTYGALSQQSAASSRP